MAIGIYGIRFAPPFQEPVRCLLDTLKSAGHELRVHERFHPFVSEALPSCADLPTFKDLSAFPEMNLLISIGGDGTLLDTARIVRDSGIPVLGVNTGRLGFLSLFNLEEPEALAKYILRGGFELEGRSLIQLSSSDVDLGDFAVAMNEVTLHKKDTSSMITVHTWADDQYLNSYWADGLIVATPTGSTAYSLSCGGPIVMPGSENFILTPIAPHNLNVRPFVIPNQSVLRLRAEGREPTSLLTIDSRSVSIPDGAEVILRRAPFELNLVVADDHHFFSTIRGKMMWGIDKRN